MYPTHDLLSYSFLLIILLCFFPMSYCQVQHKCLSNKYLNKIYINEASRNYCQLCNYNIAYDPQYTSCLSFQSGSRVTSNLRPIVYISQYRLTSFPDVGVCIKYFYFTTLVITNSYSIDYSLFYLSKNKRFQGTENSNNSVAICRGDLRNVKIKTIVVSSTLNRYTQKQLSCHIV